MTIREQIVAAALSYVGTPFHHQTRLPGSKGGLDCAGVVVCSHEEAGLEVFDDRVYARRPNPRRLLETLSVSFREVAIPEALPGDVVLFAYREHKGKPMPQHMGVLVESVAGEVPQMVHAREEQRDRYSKVKLADVEATWMQRLDSVWRHRELA